MGESGSEYVDVGRSVPALLHPFVFCPLSFAPYFCPLVLRFCTFVLLNLHFHSRICNPTFAITPNASVKFPFFFSDLTQSHRTLRNAERRIPTVPERHAAISTIYRRSDCRRETCVHSRKPCAEGGRLDEVPSRRRETYPAHGWQRCNRRGQCVSRELATCRASYKSNQYRLYLDYTPKKPSSACPRTKLDELKEHGSTFSPQSKAANTDYIRKTRV